MPLGNGTLKVWAQICKWVIVKQQMPDTFFELGATCLLLAHCKWELRWISSVLAETELKAFTPAGNTSCSQAPREIGISGEKHLCSYLLPPAAQELSLCWKCSLKCTDSLRVGGASAMSKRADDRKQTKGRSYNIQQIKHQKNSWWLDTDALILLEMTPLLLAHIGHMFLWWISRNSALQTSMSVLVLTTIWLREIFPRNFLILTWNLLNTSRKMVTIFP